jgi:CheY-like chemotaxis protein
LPASTTGAGDKTAKILLIDDDRNYLKFTTIQLKDAGYSVVAMSIALLKRPALILLDLGLPGGGLAFLERLQLNLELVAVPVIIVTARDANSHREGVLKAGARQLLQQLFETTVLLEAIRSIIGAPDPDGEAECARGYEATCDDRSTALLREGFRNSHAGLAGRRGLVDLCQQPGRSRRLALKNQAADERAPRCCSTPADAAGADAVPRFGGRRERIRHNVPRRRYDAARTFRPPPQRHAHANRRRFR